MSLSSTGQRVNVGEVTALMSASPSGHAPPEGRGLSASLILIPPRAGPEPDTQQTMKKLCR